MQSILLIADLGPEFDGWAGLIDGRMVCMAPPEYAHDAERRRSLRELVERAGGKCADCLACMAGEGA